MFYLSSIHLPPPLYTWPCNSCQRCMGTIPLRSLTPLQTCKQARPQNILCLEQGTIVLSVHFEYYHIQQEVCTNTTPKIILILGTEGTFFCFVIHFQYHIHTVYCPIYYPLRPISTLPNGCTTYYPLWADLYCCLYLFMYCCRLHMISHPKAEWRCQYWLSLDLCRP